MKRPTSPSLDRHELYELCTQTPQRDVRLLRAIHGGSPRVLGEDFAGTAALSRAWVRLVADGRAIAVDHDPEPLARAKRATRVVRHVADVQAVRSRCDLLVAFNFSIGEFHQRKALVNYLRHARSRLSKGGLFACDLYGGNGAFTTGTLRETRELPTGGHVRYAWEQRGADRITHEVENALHFRVEPAHGGAAQVQRDAFVYRWRLWSLPELRDALDEAGFSSCEVWSRFEHAIDGRGQLHPLRHRTGSDLPEEWCVFVIGRR